MDPLMSAWLATRLGPSPETEDRDGLAWSTLPTAPVIADPPSRASVVTHGVAAALRRATDRIDRRRRVRKLAQSDV
ncbi:MAG: hypothetical protein M3N47_14915 [Chloroflexota bacterium]|nr:hypothetical protein [Chloroflexota bacterium]